MVMMAFAVGCTKPDEPNNGCNEHGNAIGGHEYVDLGLYWSASLNKEFPYRAWGFHFNCDSSQLCGSSDRNRGQMVRAVCSIK